MHRAKGADVFALADSMGPNKGGVFLLKAQ